MGCNSNGADSDTKAESDKSDVTDLDTKLNVAITPQPSTLDQHMTTTTIVSIIGRHIYEQLVTLNASYEVIPMLAESIDESEDGKVYTFHLREGVQFHNGKELKAEDVTASWRNG